MFKNRDEQSCVSLEVILSFLACWPSLFEGLQRNLRCQCLSMPCWLPCHADCHAVPAVISAHATKELTIAIVDIKLQTLIGLNTSKSKTRKELEM